MCISLSLSLSLCIYIYIYIYIFLYGPVDHRTTVSLSAVERVIPTHNNRYNSRGPSCEFWCAIFCPELRSRGGRSIIKRRNIIIIIVLIIIIISFYHYIYIYISRSDPKHCSQTKVHEPFTNRSRTHSQNITHARSRTVRKQRAPPSKQVSRSPLNIT